MTFHRHLKPKFMILIPLLLALVIAVACGEDATPTPTTAPPTPTATTAPVATPTPTPPPAAAFRTSTTKTLVAAWGPPVEQPLVPWLSRGIDLHIYHIYERLIGLHHATGEFDQSTGLAQWSLSADGKDFTFKLVEGVQFHGGWGEYTSADVVHMVDKFLGDDSTVREKPIFERITVEVLDKYNFIFKQDRPDILSLPQHCAGQQGACAAMSKAFWDAEGIDGYSKKPISTGPWSFVSWVPGAEVVAERVTDHWRKVPEFEQYKLQFSAEPATRMAMLLSDEAHMVTIPRVLQKTLTDRGFELVFSTLPALGVSWHFGGMHLEFDKLVAAGFDMTTSRNRVYPSNLDDAYYAKSPWAHPVTGILVREALSRAVNREELNDTIFAGQGDPAYIWGMHESLNGWSDRWGKEFDDKYGYDPVKARALLKEAGFDADNPLKFSVQTFERFDFPENISHTEVMADYFKDIGVEVTLIASDTTKRNRQQRERAMQGQVEPFFGGYRVFQGTYRSYYGQPGGGATFEDEFLWTNYEKLISTVDLGERAVLITEVADYLFDRYASIPLFWFNAPAILNPDVIAEYNFAGNSRRVYTHTEYIKAANVR